MCWLRSWFACPFPVPATRPSRCRFLLAWGGVVLLGLGLSGCAWWNPPPEDPVQMRRPSDWLKQPRPEAQYQVQ